MNNEELLISLAILFAACFIRGVTGFGSGLIAVPLLAHGAPLQSVVPVVMSLDFVASFIIGGVGGKQADWREIGILLPFGPAGALFGRRGTDGALSSIRRTGRANTSRAARGAR